MTAEDRFFRFVNWTDDPGACWIWSGAKTKDGYGLFCPSVREQTVGAHRWAYEFLRADIPDGLEIDHMCRETRCVNPWHLEPVDRNTNMGRRTRLSDEEHRSLMF